MFPRTLGKSIQQSAKNNKVLGLVGPRQSGKTTLAKASFPDYEFLSLENPDIRLRAITDARTFLAQLKKNTILDEVQNAPQLFSYLQEIVDNKKDDRRFILTGPNSFQLSDKIAQSLAGRIRIFNILPLTRSEIPQSLRPKTLDESILKGQYPRIFDENLEPGEWFGSYYQTYIQKDVRSILNISDLNQFDRFVRLSAGRVATLTDFSQIASDLGISQPTAVRWASVLESSFICFRLQPHFRNFGKRIVKSPKMYFFDTGLLCQLLRIQTVDQLSVHPLRGSIFENYVIAESMKINFNCAMDLALYYWRDQHGHEIDLIIDKSSDLIPIEIKSGATFHPEWLKNLKWFAQLQNQGTEMLIYGGDETFSHQSSRALAWDEFDTAVEQILKD